MAVKITTQKIYDQDEILEDLIRLGSRGHFFSHSPSMQNLIPELTQQTENTVDVLSDSLQERLHNPKNYMMACVSFALYVGMAGYYLWKTDEDAVREQEILKVLLYRSDLLSLDSYVTDLTGIYEEKEYAGKLRDFLGLFETRALMLCCGNDLEKLNVDTCKVAACAMYRLGILIQAERMREAAE